MARGIFTGIKCASEGMGFDEEIGLVAGTYSS